MTKPGTETWYEHEEKLRKDGAPPEAIAAFRFNYERWVRGDQGWVPESSIEPVDRLPSLEEIAPAYRSRGEEALGRTVLIKLNGGLGTSMGLAGPKSLVTVKDGRTFLDITLGHVQFLQRPLLLMNSFATAPATASFLAARELPSQPVRRSFSQHRVPKVDPETGRPARWPEDPDLEWCPPGHGDLYPAVRTRGVLRELLAAGFRYAFVSNIDNLGATLDLGLLGYLAAERISFLMEVTQRTPADRKGGHLARAQDGRLVLREVAQCPAGDLPAFQDIARHRYFNTNNLWIDLEALDLELSRRGGFLPLPLIANRKPVDPTRPASPVVVQLENAMGAAVSCFERARAVAVPRDRFLAVKTCNDLLVTRSDATRLTEDFRLVPDPHRRAPFLPLVDLDERYYGLLHDFQERFPGPLPSLAHCLELKVIGDICFAAPVVCDGVVELVNGSDRQVVIEKPLHVTGRHVFG
ncbi:MAG: UTP--glucose-1-phosphate uridylyltransferase [Acidobacteriota bacterium]